MGTDMGDTGSGPDSPVPTTEGADVPMTDAPASTVTDVEWEAMLTVLNNIYAHRTEE